MDALRPASQAFGCRVKTGRLIGFRVARWVAGPEARRALVGGRPCNRLLEHALIRGRGGDSGGLASGPSHRHTRERSLQHPPGTTARGNTYHKSRAGRCTYRSGSPTPNCVDRSRRARYGVRLPDIRTERRAAGESEEWCALYRSRSDTGVGGRVESVVQVVDGGSHVTEAPHHDGAGIPDETASGLTSACRKHF